jgi:class 3 adenylate cyclase
MSCTAIAITQQVFDQVHSKIPEILVSIGKVKLKNIQRPVEVYRIILGHPCDHDRVKVARISHAA